MKTKRVTEGGWVIYCPACDEHHVLYDACWTFSGTLECPTFTPSLKVSGCLRQPDANNQGGKYGVCHSNITNGCITYHNDCTHAFVGRTVDLPDLER